METYSQRYLKLVAEGPLVMPSIKQLRVKVFADGADLKIIETMAANPLIKGFTTNPTLMRKASVTDYVAFAREALRIVPDRPISFEVFSDDFAEHGDAGVRDCIVGLQRVREDSRHEYLR